MVEDVGAFVDGEGGAHFAEHVVLGFACEGFLVLGSMERLGGWPFFFFFWGDEGDLMDVLFVGMVALVMDGWVVFV